MGLPEFISRTLADLAAEDRLRRIPQPRPDLVDFCSNDYLGLARAAARASAPMSGAGGARLLAGTHAAHLSLERACATHFQAEAALLFNSGYQANVGLLSALGQRGDTFLHDAACHASIKDGMRLSLAQHFAFAHNDLQDLERLLAKTKGNRYIVVERLYSMDGDWCDLTAILRMAEAHGAWVVVDEAHSVGLDVRGETKPDGKSEVGSEKRKDESEKVHGVAHRDFPGDRPPLSTFHFHLASSPNGEDSPPSDHEGSALLARMAGFGKAVGLMGAAVLGSQALIDFLVNRSRAWIYSTAMPPALAAAIEGNIATMAGMAAERARLRRLRQELEAALAGAGWEVVRGDSPIYPLVAPGNARCKALAAKAQAAGFDVKAVLAPTVPAGAERIRIVLHAFNTAEEVRGLAAALTA